MTHACSSGVSPSPWRSSAPSPVTKPSSDIVMSAITFTTGSPPPAVAVLDPSGHLGVGVDGDARPLQVGLDHRVLDHRALAHHHPLPDDAEKKAEEQSGLLGKLANQVEDATKTIVDFPETAKTIATKAWQDGKKEILNVWEDSKKQLVNSLSDYTTKAIKDAKTELYNDIKDEMLAMVAEAVKKAEEDQKEKSGV